MGVRVLVRARARAPMLVYVRAQLPLGDFLQERSAVPIDRMSALAALRTAALAADELRSGAKRSAARADTELVMDWRARVHARAHARVHARARTHLWHGTGGCAHALCWRIRNV